MQILKLITARWQSSLKNLQQEHFFSCITIKLGKTNKLRIQKVQNIETEIEAYTINKANNFFKNFTTKYFLAYLPYMIHAWKPQKWLNFKNLEVAK